MDTYEIYKNARDAAWKALLDCGTTRLPVDLRMIALALDIAIISYDAGAQLIRRIDGSGSAIKNDGFSGVFSGQKTIFYNQDMPSIGRRRFTIGHEIGHLVLGHHSNFNNEDIETFDPIEVAANTVSRDLLMPAIVLKELDLHTPAEIMHVCNSSYKSAVIRARRMEVLYKRGAWERHPLERAVKRQFREYIERNKKY